MGMPTEISRLKAITYPLRVTTANLGNDFQPWLGWYPGLNVAFQKQHRRLTLIELVGDLSQTGPKSHWTSQENWTYRSHHEVSETSLQGLTSDIAIMIFDGWIQARTDILKLSNLLGNLDAKNQELPAKLGWAAIWESVLREERSISKNRSLLSAYLLFLSSLDSSRGTLQTWTAPSGETVNLCAENELIAALQKTFMVEIWREFESLFLQGRLATGSVFTTLYLPPPNENLVTEIKVLAPAFLQWVYNESKKNSDPSTDMDQYRWNLLAPLLKS